MKPLQVSGCHLCPFLQPTMKSLKTKCRYDWADTTTWKAARTLNGIRMRFFIPLQSPDLGAFSSVPNSTAPGVSMSWAIFHLCPSSAILSFVCLNTESVLLLPHHSAHFLSLWDYSMLFAGTRWVRTLHLCVFVKTFLSFSAHGLSLLCSCL